jgi:hypothetical protein
MAARCGHTVTEVYEDHTVGGAKSSEQRPALSRLLKDAVRRRFDITAVWAVDRLGRSLTDSAEHVADPEAEQGRLAPASARHRHVNRRSGQCVLPNAGRIYEQTP